MSLSLDKSTWKRVFLGDVASASKEKVDPTGGTVGRFIAGEHMDSDDLKIHRWGSTEEAELGPAFHRRFRPGQVLYGSRRTYLRKVAVADFDGVCANTTFVVETRDADVMLQEFLPFVMTSEPFHAFAIAESKGSVNPYVNWSDIERYEFDLPPLDEQKRIADLLWAVERHRMAEQGVASGLQRAAAAFREGVFGVPEADRLDAHVDVQLGQQRAPQHALGGHVYPYIRAANVTRAGLDVTDLKEMNFDPKEWGKFRLRHGDVLVTEGCGSVKELGNSAVWSDPNNERDMFFQKTLLRLRAKGPSVTPSLVREWALWAQESGKFASVANGTGILHITGVRCSGLPFPRMTDEALDRSSRNLDAVADATKVLSERLVALDALRSSLLNDVFGDN